MYEFLLGDYMCLVSSSNSSSSRSMLIYELVVHCTNIELLFLVVVLVW